MEIACVHDLVDYCVRFQVLMVASMKIGAFWDVAPCSLGVDRRSIALMMETVCTSESWSTQMRLHGAASHKALNLGRLLVCLGF
jgi:hypothetical protein